MKHLQALLTAIICGALMQGLSSCTDVDLHEETLNSHRTGVTYKFDMKNISTNVPDTMCVIANRVLDLWKSSMKVSSKNGKGSYLYNPELMVFGTDSLASDTTVLNSFHLHSGIYKFFAFTYGADQLDYTSVDTFLTETDALASDIYVKYRVYKRNDSLLRFPLIGWTDYNRYLGDTTYMQPNLSAICYQTVGNRTLSNNGSATITFTPKRATQNVTISFDILKRLKDDDGNPLQPFLVDSVYAEVSGVPIQLGIVNGYIDITKTAKTMFKMKLAKADTKTNTKVSCSAAIDVPTIVKGQTRTELSGPGILQVIIFTHAADDDKQVMRVQGRINLYDKLNEAKMYKLSDDGKHVVRNGEKKTLKIDATLTLDGASIVKDGGDDSMNRWVFDGGNTIIIHI